MLMRKYLRSVSKQKISVKSVNAEFTENFQILGEKTKKITFREHPHGVTLKTCDLRLDTSDTDYISDNCDQQY